MYRIQREVGMTVSKAERFTIKILTPVSGGSDQNSSRLNGLGNFKLNHAYFVNFTDFICKFSILGLKIQKKNL